MSRLAAVTGATGFLGRRLVSALITAGFSVRALVRRDWKGEAIEVVRGDLGDGEALARLTDGAELLIHVAGAVKARGRRDFLAVNCDGAGRAALAAARAGARGILVSSLVAREPQLSDYAMSKQAGEVAARQALGDRLTILRPPAIYGPGDLATLDLFRAAANSPVLPVPDSPAARVALAYVDDVSGVICDLASADAGPGPFAFGGARPSGYAWTEIVAALTGATGRSPRVVRVPSWALTATAAAAQGLSTLTGAPSMLTPGKAREILHADWSVAATDAPPGAERHATDLDEGFARTLRWYRDQAWIPRSPGDESVALR